MAVITGEVEVISSLPATKLFKAYNDFENIALKVDPQTYKAIDLVQGDGGVGTIKSFTYGDGVPYTSLKLKVDAIDANNHSLSYTIFEGDALMGLIESTSQQLKFIPANDGGSIYKHTSTYNCKVDAKLTEETLNLINEAHKKTFKEVEAYLIANPDAY